MPYGATGFCNRPLGRSTFSRRRGSGGPSSCAYGTSAIPSSPSERNLQGICETQLPGRGSSVIPSDGVRDIPDVSLFAANGVWGHYYVFCYSQPAAGTAVHLVLAIRQLVRRRRHLVCRADCGRHPGAGEPGDRRAAGQSELRLLRAGQAGVRRDGQQLLQLVAGNGSDSSCTFYDVTLGDNDVNCSAPSTATGRRAPRRPFRLGHRLREGLQHAPGLGLRHRHRHPQRK